LSNNLELQFKHITEKNPNPFTAGGMNTGGEHYDLRLGNLNKNISVSPTDFSKNVKEATKELLRRQRIVLNEKDIEKLKNAGFLRQGGQIIPNRLKSNKI